MKRLCLWLFLAAIPAAAQFSSAIQGTVTDASQAAVPDAVVTVTNSATGVTRTANTSGEGFYRISNLGPGTYSLKVEKTGFAGAQREGVALAITDISRVDIMLTVGASRAGPGGGKRTVARDRAGSRIRPHRPYAVARD